MCLCVYPSKRIHVAICGPIGTKFGTHMQIHLEKVVGKNLPCVMQGGIWHTYADSSENEHRLKNNYPLKTPGGILRGLCGQKLKPGKCGQTASLIAG